MSKVIEIVRFRPRDGLREENLRAASAGMEEGFASKQPGFLSRSLAKGADGEWVDVIYWQDLKSATDAAETAMNSEACMPYFEMIDEESIVMSHY